jgi:stearoyl-CoA desaturase (delta-9 desaturase)
MTAIIFTLLATHLTIASVTLYLHRSQAHRGVEFHPAVSHFMRFWLWMTTGQITRQWVAVHRKHHRFTEVEGDPHSPHVFGFWRVLIKGAFLYHTASKDSVMVAQYGAGTPDDWIEQNVYTRHSRLGILLMLLIDILLFGWWGFVVWGIQMIWIPFWAAGVVNGAGHWWGYRNGETKDHSQNLSPIGIIIGGEELHNNHHLDPASPKFSLKPWEFDIGWMYLKTFEFLGLAKIKSK